MPSVVTLKLVPHNSRVRLQQAKGVGSAKRPPHHRPQHRRSDRGLLSLLRTAKLLVAQKWPWSGKISQTTD